MHRSRPPGRIAYVHVPLSATDQGEDRHKYDEEDHAINTTVSIERQT
jgi:hypothetical protein